MKKLLITLLAIVFFTTPIKVKASEICQTLTHLLYTCSKFTGDCNFLKTYVFNELIKSGVDVDLSLSTANTCAAMCALGKTDPETAKKYLRNFLSMCENGY